MLGVSSNDSVTSVSSPQWTLALRIPDWCTGATLDGEPVSATGYLEIRRTWQAGDTVTLTLPMPPRLTVPHPAADALRGTVAIERGPVVYCQDAMNGLETPQSLDDDAHRISRLQRAARADPLRDVLTIDELPHHVVRAIREGREVMERCYVWMLDLRRKSRFTEKTLVRVLAL